MHDYTDGSCGLDLGLALTHTSLISDKLLFLSMLQFHLQVRIIAVIHG